MNFCVTFENNGFFMKSIHVYYIYIYIYDDIDLYGDLNIDAKKLFESMDCYCSMVKGNFHYPSNLWLCTYFDIGNLH